MELSKTKIEGIFILFFLIEINIYMKLKIKRKRNSIQNVTAKKKKFKPSSFISGTKVNTQLN